MRLFFALSLSSMIVEVCPSLVLSSSHAASPESVHHTSSPATPLGWAWDFPCPWDPSRSKIQRFYVENRGKRINFINFLNPVAKTSPSGSLQGHSVCHVPIGVRCPKLVVLLVTCKMQEDGPARGFKPAKVGEKPAKYGIEPEWPMVVKNGIPMSPPTWSVLR